jgi:hypothetical protein
MTFSTPSTDSTAEMAGMNRAWSNSRHVCALADHDRHWGHVVLTDCWHAYDAIHPSELGTGFTYLGAFLHRSEAKSAVEVSVARPDAQRAHVAAAGSTSWGPDHPARSPAGPARKR